MTYPQGEDKPVAPVPPSDSGTGSGDSAEEQTPELRYDPDAAEETAGESIGAFFRELPVLLVIAFVLAFLLRTFVVQVFFIPSGSMRPTLEVDDRIVVEKITYQFREPRRGEIVVFEGEPNGHQDPQASLVTRLTRGFGQFLGLVPANARDFVKRVVGLPGDTVEIRDGVVFVNGVQLDEPYVTFEDNRSFGPFEVPEGRLFFLGDNRPSSSDSRLPTGIGMVPIDRVVGRAMAIIWPVDHFEGLGRADYGDIPDGGDPPPPSDESTSGSGSEVWDRSAYTRAA